MASAGVHSLAERLGLMNEPKINIALEILIVGAGLSGLVAAIGFRKAQHEVTVLEKAPGMREVGAGIQIPINSARALQGLGVLDKILSRATRPRDITLRSYKTGSALNSLNLDPYTQETYGLPILVIHRADFCRILYEEAKSYGVDFRLGCAVSSISFSGPTVQLSTGETVNGDLIIGADGERSVCREALLKRPDPPRPNGRLVYRILVDVAQMSKYSELLNLISPPCVDIWAGPNGHIVCYLLKEHYNVVIFFPDRSNDTIYGPQPADLDHLRELLYGWEPRLQKLLEIAQTSLRWSLLETDELESWVHHDGKFALLGDAAHACLPFIAHGAAMGVESAALLSNLLTHARHSSEICDLLKLYNSAQLPRATRVIERSRLMGDTLEMPDGPAQVERDRELYCGVPKAGFPFAWADPDLQSFLWSYDTKSKADSIWREYSGIRSHGLESVAADPI